MAELAGIGFTVSMLIAELAYPADPQLLDTAKGAVLIASATATILGGSILAIRAAHYRRQRSIGS